MARLLRWLMLPCLFASPAALQAADSGRPNVLMIAVDDLNHWVGHLGRNRQSKTPNIDRLAARGVTFARAYCAAPVCNPSRAALMSGLRPWASGVYDNSDDWRTVIPAELCLTSAFRKAGYYVAGTGKIYHERYARRSEWDDYFNKTGADPKPAGNTGVGGIKFAPLDCRDEDLREWKIVNYGIEQLQKKHEKPFFLAVGLHKPHMPWNVPRKYFDLHPLSEIELPPHRDDDLSDVPRSGVDMADPQGDHANILAAGRWKDAVQAYLAAISFTDAMIGRLLDAFDESAYSANTIVVLWGDHGWHLGEKQHWRKFALWEEATRAPLIWVAPGVTRAGGVSDRTIDFMSIYPTLTELCGIPTPDHIQGGSIKSLLVDPQAAWDRPALTTFGRHNHAVRTAGWRYIGYANGEKELYDESRDPYEWTNLASDPQFTDRLNAMTHFLPDTNAPQVNQKQKVNAEAPNAR